MDGSERHDAFKLADPHAQLRHDLNCVIKKLKQQYNCNFVIMGDFNINMHKDSKERAAIVKWADDNDFENPYLRAQGGGSSAAQLTNLDNQTDRKRKYNTWYKRDIPHKPNDPTCDCRLCQGKNLGTIPTTMQKDPKGHLDHAYISKDLYRRNCVAGYAVAALQVAGSDHRPVLLTIDLEETLGIGRAIQNTVPTRKRILKYVNEKQREEYAAALQTRIQESSLQDGIDAMYDKRTEVTQHDQDLVMKTLTDCLIQAEEDIDKTPARSSSRKFLQGHTRDTLEKQLASRYCKGIIKQIKNHDKQYAVDNYKKLHDKFSHLLDLPAPPHAFADRKEWDKWGERVAKQQHRFRKQLHHKQRVEDKKQRSEHDRKIEEARQNSRECKKFFSYVSNNEYQPPATEIFHEGQWKSGDELIETERANLEQHMYGRSDTFHSEASKNRINPFCELNEEGKRLRRQVATGDSTEWHQYVPQETIPFYNHGKCIVPTEQLGLYDGIFNTEVTFDEFENYCFSKTHNKAGGKTGIRTDHICSAYRRERKLIYKVMSLPYITGKSFTDWNYEIINWIPKEPGNKALNRRRPIALLEVMRKLTLGVRKNRVLNIWKSQGCIDKDNFAFIPGEFIHDPILLKRMLLEDAAWMQEALITLDVDYKAAFDKVPYFIKEMALRRMGLPEEGIALWCAHDETRQQAVRTAYGLSPNIHPRCGAFGQGGEESPMGFVALMCWKCAYIFDSSHEKDFDPYLYTVTPERVIPLSKTLFCDDSSYTTASVSKVHFIPYWHVCSSSGHGTEYS